MATWLAIPGSRRAWWLAAALLLCACGTRTPSGPICPHPIGRSGPDADLLLVAVGHRFEVADTTSWARFRASVLEPFEREVRPCLRADGRNLLVYPEDMGLLAAFLGERAAKAREAATSADAFLLAGINYLPIMAAYRERFGALGDARALTLAMTNVVWQAMDRIFGEVARRGNAYVVVSFNAAYPVTHSDDPALIATFGDPLFPDDVYVAAVSEVYNLAALYGPDGELVAVAPKRYLVPAEESLLELAYGSITEPALLPTPWGDLGVVISKDAWMPDVLRRLEDLGARILVQPEAFSGWTITEVAAWEWLPEVFTESAWLHTQRHPPFAHTVVPMLTGNLFELVFDGQSHVTTKATPDGPRLGFVGMAPTAGFLSVGPWAFPDETDLPLTERRQRLRALGEALRPGGAHAGAYAHSLAFAMVATPTTPVARRPRAVQLDDGTTLTLWLHGDRLLWTTGIPDEAQTGRTLAEAVRSFDLAAHRDEALAVWSAGPPGRERLWLTRFRAGNWGRSWRPVTTAGPAWWPSLARDPATGRWALAWIDYTTGWGAVHLAEGTGTTTSWSARIDGKEATDLRGPRRNAAPPDVAYRNGRIVVVWSDFRDYAWGIYATTATAAGPGTTVVRIDAAPGSTETLHAEPTVLLRADGEAWIVWSDLAERRPYPLLGSARWPTGGAPRPLTPPSSPSGVVAPTLAETEAGLWVAWQWVRPDGIWIGAAPLDSDGQLGALERSTTSGVWTPTWLTPVGTLLAGTTGATPVAVTLASDRTD